MSIAAIVDGVDQEYDFNVRATPAAAMDPPTGIPAAAPQVVIYLCVKDMHVGRRRRLSPSGPTLQLAFPYPQLSVFLLPELSRGIVAGVLSTVPVANRASTLARWIRQTSSVFTAAAAEAASTGWPGMVGVVEIRRYVIEEASATEQVTPRGEIEGCFGGVPASASSIEMLEAVRCGGEGGCVVCCEDFGAGDELRKMPCKHVFHRSCITRWLGNSHVCPLCRFKMPKVAI